MSKDLTWPTDRMAKFIDVSPRRLQQLVQEGVVPRSNERGRYNPIAVNLAYIRFLRDRAQSPELSNSEFYEAKLAKIKAEVVQLELQTARLREDWWPFQEVKGLILELATIVRATLIGNENKILSFELINDVLRQLRDAYSQHEANQKE